eukprot:TRINITY_DN2807_c0_g2_i2.p1 TRINITY_DN2807_c0_g2~~TRINITY_DN2807_c0_g2_i2.p1  ORF type:complete len:140 (+),score=4.13 TRINITY_DN2807_c0_g2_i2:53-421(+)
MNEENKNLIFANKLFRLHPHIAEDEELKLLNIVSEKGGTIMKMATANEPSDNVNNSKDVVIVPPETFDSPVCSCWCFCYFFLAQLCCFFKLVGVYRFFFCFFLCLVVYVVLFFVSKEIWVLW